MDPTTNPSTSAPNPPQRPHPVGPTASSDELTVLAHIAALNRRRQRPSPTAVGRALGDLPRARVERLVTRLLREELLRDTSTRDGQHHRRLEITGFGIGELVRAGHLSASDLIAFLKHLVPADETSRIAYPGADSDNPLDTAAAVLGEVAFALWGHSVRSSDHDLPVHQGDGEPTHRPTRHYDGGQPATP